MGGYGGYAAGGASSGLNQMTSNIMNLIMAKHQEKMKGVQAATQQAQFNAMLGEKKKMDTATIANQGAQTANKGKALDLQTAKMTAGLHHQQLMENQGAQRIQQGAQKATTAAKTLDAATVQRGQNVWNTLIKSNPTVNQYFKGDMYAKNVDSFYKDAIGGNAQAQLPFMDSVIKSYTGGQALREFMATASIKSQSKVQKMQQLYNSVAQGGLLPTSQIKDIYKTMVTARKNEYQTVKPMIDGARKAASQFGKPAAEAFNNLASGLTPPDMPSRTNPSSGPSSGAGAPPVPGAIRMTSKAHGAGYFDPKTKTFYPDATQ